MSCELHVPDVVVWCSDGAPARGRSYADRIVERLPDRWSVRVVDVRARGLTVDELAAPVHVLTGGDTSAFAGDEATARILAQLTEVARRAWADEATIVGICLGSQLLSRVIAPELPRSSSPHGMEAGWVTVESTTIDGGDRQVATLHYEQVAPAFADLDGVTVTHSNAHSPIQGYRWGPSVVGLQFHPEWSPADLRETLAEYADVLAAHHRRPDLARQTMRFARRAWRPDTFHELVTAPIAARIARSTVPGFDGKIEAVS